MEDEPLEKKPAATKNQGCPYCSLEVPERSMEDHKRLSHCWGSFLCPVCGLRVEFAKDLREHMLDVNHVQVGMGSHLNQCVKLVLIRASI